MFEKEIAKMHATMINFGYPDTLIHEYQSWNVLLRPRQATLGALVLVSRDEATAFSDLSPEAFGELAQIVNDIERALTQTFAYDKINYLALMMVDPHVHFHVLPRYQNPREFNGQSFTDAHWPGPPGLADAIDLDSEGFSEVLETLRRAWP